MSRLFAVSILTVLTMAVTICPVNAYLATHGTQTMYNMGPGPGVCPPQGCPPMAQPGPMYGPPPPPQYPRPISKVTKCKPPVQSCAPMPPMGPPMMYPPPMCGPPACKPKTNWY